MLHERFIYLYVESIKAMRHLLFVIFCFHSIALFGQSSKEVLPQLITNIIEDFLESSENENFDYNTVFEQLNYYFEHPLNINSATENQLRDLVIISEVQISDFLNHRAQFGNFLSIYELQSIPSWNLVLIRAVLPFLKCEVAAVDYNLNFYDALTKGKSSAFLKVKRILEPRKGFIPNASGNIPFEGDPFNLYVRYRYEYGQLFKAGFTMEKDPGEKLFGKASPYGFDFYSFFLFARRVNKYVDAVVLGDYAVSLGQGLILHNDFGTGKSSFVMNIKRAGRSLRPYSSVNETNFFRGAGTIINLNKNIQTVVFASYKPINATVYSDTLDNNDFDSFGSIRMDGFHRTVSEIAAKNSIMQTNFGTKFSYQNKGLRISMNGLYTAFDIPFVRSEQLYRKFLFSGSRLINTSIDYTYRYKNYTFFGETAISDNLATANIHGVLIGLDRKMDLSVLYRKFDVDYHVLGANAFGDASQPINEEGLYLGSEIRPLRGFSISTYLDLWRNPWVGYRRDGPSVGRDFLLRMQYVKRRKFDAYAQYRWVNKMRNLDLGNNFVSPLPYSLQRLRLHFGYKISKEWEIRDRVEFSFFKDVNNSSPGLMMYQDVIYRPIAKAFSFNARYAIFDVSSFDARIYAYENDLLYEFYIPFFFNKGSRFYVNTRWRIMKNYTWEFRVGRTFFQNVDGISSGNNFINGRTITELKTQLRIAF